MDFYTILNSLELGVSTKFSNGSHDVPSSSLNFPNVPKNNFMEI
jgi:hypothetical protein